MPVVKKFSECIADGLKSLYPEIEHTFDLKRNSVGPGLVATLKIISTEYFLVENPAPNIFPAFYEWAIDHLSKAANLLRSKQRKVQDCLEHDWMRRRDGRQCQHCHKIEFGVPAHPEVDNQYFSMQRTPEVIMNQQQNRIRELEDMLHKYYESSINSGVLLNLKHETEKMLGIVETLNLG